MNSLGGVFEDLNLYARLAELTTLQNSEEVWFDPNRMKKIAIEKNAVESQINDFEALDNNYKILCELIKTAVEEGENDLLVELEGEMAKLSCAASSLQARSFLNGPVDNNDCYLEINSGAGGREAQDWVIMLERMYFRWAENSKRAVEVVDASPGEGGGFKTVIIKITEGYGWLKKESGVHRLVRISPFDSGARRHTSFASVWVTPVVDDSIEVIINENDLRIDTYRASGAGGQHVNKTESAIRITHIPSGIVVQCQNDRSQHRNKTCAMSMLKAKLYEAEVNRKKEEIKDQESGKKAIEWGNQIRSYVLQPYQMVKDARTGVETGNAQGVLDGDIDKFLIGSLLL